MDRGVRASVVVDPVGAHPKDEAVRARTQNPTCTAARSLMSGRIRFTMNA